MTILTVAAVATALICSYGIILHPSSAPTDFKFLLNPLILFLLNVLVTLFVVFLIAIITIGLLDPWRAEITAKLLGAEFSYKMKYEESQQSVDRAERDAERIRGLIAQAFQDWEDWSRQIARVNGAVLEYLSAPFEDILVSAPSPPDAVRQAVRDVLVNAYVGPGGSAVSISVIPLIDETIESLGDPLAAKVRLSYAGVSDVATVRDGTGIAIHHRDEGFGTVIILDGLEGYEVSLAEIYAASTLFVTVAGAIMDGLSEET